MQYAEVRLDTEGWHQEFFTHPVVLCNGRHKKLLDTLSEQRENDPGHTAEMTAEWSEVNIQQQRKAESLRQMTVIMQKHGDD